MGTLNPREKKRGDTWSPSVRVFFYPAGRKPHGRTRITRLYPRLFLVLCWGEAEEQGEPRLQTLRLFLLPWKAPAARWRQCALVPRRFAPGSEGGGFGGKTQNSGTLKKVDLGGGREERLETRPEICP